MSYSADRLNYFLPTERPVEVSDRLDDELGDCLMGCRAERYFKSFNHNAVHNYLHLSHVLIVLKTSLLRHHHQTSIDWLVD